MVAGTVTSASRVGAAGWDVVVGDRFIAALGAPADAEALAALAALTADDGVGIEELIQVIPGIPGDDDGADQGFAVVWWSRSRAETDAANAADAAGGPVQAPASGHAITAVVRGEAVVDLDSPGGSRRFDSRGIRPWHLAEFRDVTGIRIAATGAPLHPSTETTEAAAPARVSFRATDVAWSPNGSRPGREVDDRSHGTRTDELVLEDTVADFAEHDADLLAGGASTFAPGAAPRVRIGSEGVRTVTVPILVGRRPLAPRAPAAAATAPELVPVRSATGVVSGTHLELRVEGARLVATDLRSTNGTVLRTPAGVRRLRAGESIVVGPGCFLDLGDDTIIEVLPADDDTPRPTRTDRPHS
ncbi:FHA domain-containing protein [Agromyces sp. NPDC058110]|uniref:FHA domain-containing protein n=1 Tax=Agromyces sp. NPDC058110 TaxID=3346345 RepID=UPI0036DE058D